MRNHAAHALFLTAILLAPCAHIAFSQVPTSVDNVRITPANPNVGTLLELDKDTIAAASITLYDLLWYEYGFPPDKIRGLTHEQMTIRFDVVGTIDPVQKPDPKHYRSAYPSSPLVDALLQNHFRLAAHEGQEVTTSWELSAIPNRPAPTPCPPSHGWCAVKTTADPPKNACISTHQLTAQISKELQTGVADKTNLGGRFAVDLSWPSQINSSPHSPEERISNSLATQLGFWLTPSRTSTRVIVIDYVELPASLR